ncbi:NAD(P)H-dependent oxidoreductase [Hymenobacter sp. 5516J-16]|uniref:flavodoxin family protein n=1 Tax=Hymenobacter sp. 5516J-16 TaxID=2932253 RepID=UPI001FD26063|nr:NAD(P)H-dependent oxidoreductase [Hymenobacter sp. 5516J-16]UOQ77922.1 NAD(P)H-dependent oxidoreductase [Hymenobacter sp. 5516J-16]
MNKPLVILGSARSDGDTRRLVSQVLTNVPHQLIDLQQWPVAPYNYPQEYPAQDTFLALADLLLHHPVVVFATPVYWYSMSGSMKDFFDRLTELTEPPHKQLGRGCVASTYSCSPWAPTRSCPKGSRCHFAAPPSTST